MFGSLGFMDGQKQTDDEIYYGAKVILKIHLGSILIESFFDGNILDCTDEQKES